jgi:UPF0716 protein FxsA
VLKFLVLGLVATEVVLLAWLGSVVGLGMLIVYGLACFFIGVLVMRLAGAQAFRALYDRDARGQAFGTTGPDGAEQVVIGAPAAADRAQLERTAKDVGDSSLLFLAGILFAVPGILSTLAGLVMLLPAVRSAITRRLGRGLGRAGAVTVVTVEGGAPGPGGPGRPPDGPRVISGEILPPPERPHS